MYVVLTVTLCFFFPFFVFFFPPLFVCHICSAAAAATPIFHPSIHDRHSRTWEFFCITPSVSAQDFWLCCSSINSPGSCSVRTQAGHHLGHLQLCPNAALSIFNLLPGFIFNLIYSIFFFGLLVGSFLWYPALSMHIR